MSAGDATARFWFELQALYQAAGRPTLKRLVRLGIEQRPRISISDSTINDWLNRKAVPTGPKNERYLAVMISFLQAGAVSGYEPLPTGEWGRLLREAQAEKAVRKHRCRPAVPDPPAISHVISTGAFIGRDGELETLSGLVKEVAAGSGGAVLVEGEPGIGKSALVRASLMDAAALGCEVFWGTGDELGQELPLQPLLDGLRVREPSSSPRRDMVIRLLRGETTADRSIDGPTVLAEQLLALVAEQCAARPTILVIDDLQWADQATIRFWARLARTTQQMRLLLIGMLRPVPKRDDLLALRRATGDATWLRLSALKRTEVGDLVTALAGGKPDGDLLRLADGAAGNPLYVTELVAALIRSSTVVVTDSGVASVTAGSVPSSLSAAIVDRLSFVTQQARVALRAAALLGVDFAVSDLGALLGVNVSSLVPAVEEACAAGILTESPNGLSFRHPLIQAALYDEMPGAVRRAWHREAGRALAEAGAPVDRIARQLRQSVGDPMDKWTQDWVAANADLLVGQAPAVAVELLTQVLGCSPVGSYRYGFLASRLADALYRIGDRPKADEVASRVMECVTDPDLTVDLQWTLVQCRMLAGRHAEALAMLDRALEIPGLFPRRRARLLVLTARAHCHFGAVEKAGRIASAALATGTEADDAWTIGWALHVLSVATMQQGRMSDALSLFDRALAKTEADAALTDLRLLLMINKAVVLGSLDQYLAAFAVARQARDLADQVGSTHRLAQARGALCQLLFETGRWDDATAEMEALPLELKEPAGACCELSIAAIIGFHRGDITAARHSLTAMLPYAKQIGDRAIGPLTLAHSLDREQDGALSEALDILSAQFANNPEQLDEMEYLLVDAVRLAVLTGDSEAARRLTSRATAYAANSTTPHRRATALYCRGIVSQDACLLVTAAGLYEEVSRPLLRAQALEAAAREFLRIGRRDGARSALNETVNVYTRLGAAADIDRLHDEYVFD